MLTSRSRAVNLTRVCMVIVVAALLAPAVSAGGSSWTLLGGKAAYGSLGSIGYSSGTERFIAGGYSVGDHMLFAGIYIPADVGEPRANGDVLTFGSLRPGGAHVRLWDSVSGAFEIACAPPEARSIDWPCRLDLPDGHEVVYTRHGAQTTVEVLMRDASGEIVPCVRILVHGAITPDATADGRSFFFEGSLRGHLVG